MNLYVYFVRYLTALILLWKLNDEVLLITPNISGQRVFKYLRSGTFLEAREHANFSFHNAYRKYTFLERRIIITVM